MFFSFKRHSDIRHRRILRANTRDLGPHLLRDIGLEPDAEKPPRLPLHLW